MFWPKDFEEALVLACKRAYGDNPTARGYSSPANQQGDWWIGGFEDRPSKETPPGLSQGDDPQGTLTSPQFTIIGKNISFLIGGACNESFSRAELIVNSLVSSVSFSLRVGHWIVIT